MQNEKKEFIAVTIRYVAPTSTKGSRIKLSLPRFSKSKTIPYSHASNSKEESALNFFESKGLQPFACCEIEGGSALVFSKSDTNALLSIFFPNR